jgi:predicted hydrocarbon binding protein
MRRVKRRSIFALENRGNGGHPPRREMVPAQVSRRKTIHGSQVRSLPGDDLLILGIADPRAARYDLTGCMTGNILATRSHSEGKEDRIDKAGETMEIMSEQTFYYPNRWGRLVLTSAEEIVGDKGMAALLNMAKIPEYIGNYPPDDMEKGFSFEQLAQLQQAIWDMYGPRGARVFATRAGEQTFNDGLAHFGALATTAQAAMRIGSLQMKIKIGLGFFARWFNDVSDQVVSVGETDTHWLWVIKCCPMCWERTSDQPLCHLAIGVLKGGLAWVSGGRQFRLAEIECKATGGENCVIQIDKVPLD